MSSNRTRRVRASVFATTVFAASILAVLGAPPAAADATFALVTGPGPGASPLVKTFTDAASTFGQFLAYPSTMTKGVSVASGDINGDEHPDVITGTGPEAGPHVKAFDGDTGGAIMSFFAYSSTFRGGVNVAAGDVNGDGLADVITGAGPGGGPHVKVFDGDTGAAIMSFFAYSSTFRGGVNVAAGDINGDGLADIITAPQSDGGPHVKAFDGETGAAIASFFAYNSSFRGGVNLAAGDVNFDGLADIITGPGPGGGPHVKAFDSDSGTAIASFFAYDPAFRGGVYVGAAEVVADGFADIVTGAGQGGGPHVKVFDGDSGAAIASFFAYDPAFRGGVRVAGNLGTHPPVVEVTGGPADEDIISDTTPTYSGTATDSDGVVSDMFVSVDFEDFSSDGVDCTDCGTDSATWTYTPADPLPDGEHLFIFVAVDNSGLAGFDFRSVIIDTGAPTVTVDQAGGQDDPTNDASIEFTATFSESVTGLEDADVTIGGTAPGTLVADVTGGPTVYTISISGMTDAGTVTASLGADVADDAAGTGNDASTSTDNTVTYDPTLPTVTVEQAGGQVDPTNDSPIVFTATFSEAVTGFASADVTIGGTAGGTKSASVTPVSTTVYTIQITGMTTSGTVTASIPAGAASDAAGNGNAASTSTDNTVTWDVTAPTFDSITANGTTTVIATFSEPLDCATVASSDFLASIEGQPVVVNAATCSGDSDATIALTLASAPDQGDTVTINYVGSVADVAGNTAAPAQRSTDADATDPTVTVNQHANQADPTNDSPIEFTATFSEAVTGFTGSDVTIGGTAGGTKSATVIPVSTTVYTIQITGMTTSGTVTASIPADSATDAAGNGNAGSTSTDNTVTWDVTAPTVTVEQHVDQDDPADTSPIKFTATFSEPVTGFAAGDVTVTGTAGGTKTVTIVTVSTSVYTVEISGMTTDGTVIATIGANGVVDAAGNANAASTSTDNTVAWDGAPSVTVEQANGQSDPTNDSPIVFTATFSEAVTGVTSGDVTIGGTAGGTLLASVTPVSSSVYTIEITGMTTDGTVTASIPADAAADTGTFTHGNTASTSTDNTVTWDTTAPTFAWVATSAGSTTVTAVFTSIADPLLCGSVGAADFLATVDGSPVVVSSVGCSGSTDATIDLTLASAPASGDEVSVLLSGTVTDAATNAVESDTLSATASSPVVLVSGGPADGSSTSDTTPSYNGNAGDGSGTVTAVQVSIDGGLTFSSADVLCLTCGIPGFVPSWSYTRSSPLSAGTYTFVFRSIDADGNFSAPSVRRLTIT